MSELVFVLKQSRQILIGVVIGLGIMYCMDRVPLFLEVGWEPDSGYIRVDNRAEKKCELANH